MNVVSERSRLPMTTDYEPEIIEIGEIKNLSRTVSDKLEEMIYTGKLRPGDRLIQTELADRFRISRVAIRDALQELRRIGLAVSNPQLGGMVVREVSSKDVSNIAFIREAVEPLVAIEACKKIDAVGIQKMSQIIEKQVRLRDDHDYLGFLKVDWEFHRTFYSYAENDLAVEVIEKLWTRASQARGMVLINKDWGALWSGQSIEGHRNIIKAITEHDEESLVKIIRINIRKAEKEQLEWFRQVT